MFEKRKNSDKRESLSIGLALLLVLGGLFVGLNLDGLSTPIVEESLVAQDDVNLSGEWIGTITEDYGAESRYDFRLTVSQDGNLISGMSYLDMAGELEVYSESPVQGFVNGDVAVFSQVSTTVLENIQMDNWCLADMAVEYEILGGQETLVGEWVNAHFEREACDGISGRIILTRQAE